jgi:hypothetical protein
MLSPKKDFFSPAKKIINIFHQNFFQYYQDQKMWAQK